MHFNRSLLPYIIMSIVVAGCHSSRKTVVDTHESEVEWVETQVERKTKSGPEIVKEARKWLGTKYQYGGESSKGVDCSGLVMRVYKDVTGIKLPRDSRSQQAFCISLKRKDLAVGDLVFFASKRGGSRVGHVGIYIGDDKFIHASTSRGVIISSLNEAYFVNHYHSSGRVPGMSVEKSNTKEAKKTLTKKERKAAKEVKLNDLINNTSPIQFVDTTHSTTPIAPEPEHECRDTIENIVRNAFFR